MVSTQSLCVWYEIWQNDQCHYYQSESAVSKANVWNAFGAQLPMSSPPPPSTNNKHDRPAKSALKTVLSQEFLRGNRLGIIITSSVRLNTCFGKAFSSYRSLFADHLSHRLVSFALLPLSCRPISRPNDTMKSDSPHLLFSAIVKMSSICQHWIAQQSHALSKNTLPKNLSRRLGGIFPDEIIEIRCFRDSVISNVCHLMMFLVLIWK